MKLQKVETARHTPGNGISNLMTPAMMIGTEQAMVSRIVNATLINSIIAASSLDMISIFKELHEYRPLVQAQGADFTRNQAKERWFNVGQ